MNSNDPSRRIHILRDSVSRRIAAGEVIERPASVVRELLDNAIDAGASRVDLYLEGGGISRIRVVDNGSGMSEEDLHICYRSHATSKISDIDDLDTLKSLGFRGEALSSIAACSKLSITSSITEGIAYTVTVHGGDVVSSGTRAGNRGTIVEVSDLFYSIPARKKFLKRPASETGLCTKIFIDKASAFPGTQFSLHSDGNSRYILGETDLKGRLEDIHGTEHGLSVIETSSEGFSLRIMAGDPGALRRDRRLLQVFVNRRRVYEYALLQALEYGYSSVTPGGYHPVCFLFIEIDPALVDFNIHPAKREVRFKNLPEVHRVITSTLQAELKSVPQDRYYGYGGHKETPAPEGFFAAEQPAYRPADGKSGFYDLWSQLEPARDLPVQGRAYRYLGQLFGVFLLVELDESLLFIDQHAAHERIIYNELMKQGAQKQELLVPYRFEQDESDDRYLEGLRDELSNLGITLERTSPGVWQLLTVPVGCTEHDAVIADFLSNLRGSADNLNKELYATISCRAAVKEGSFLDSHAAASIIDAVLAMDSPRCPHGRPVVFTITRDFLYRQVRRS